MRLYAPRPEALAELSRRLEDLRGGWQRQLESFKGFVALARRAAGREAMSAEVVVAATPQDAFAVFTDEIGLWWRTGTPYWLEHTGFDRVPGGDAYAGGYDAGWKELLGWFAERTTQRSSST